MELNRPLFLIIHHEAGNNGFEGVNNWHKKRRFTRSSLGYFVGYHYYIAKDGLIYQARKDTDIGCHCLGGFNFKSIGICMQGNFDVELPTQKQTEAVKKICKEKMKQYLIPLENVMPHRQAVPHTSCYGKNLSNDWIKNILSEDAEVRSLTEDLKKKRQACFLLDVQDAGKLYAMTDKGVIYFKTAQELWDFVSKNSLGIIHEKILKLKGDV